MENDQKGDDDQPSTSKISANKKDGQQQAKNDGNDDDSVEMKLSETQISDTVLDAIMALGQNGRSRGIRQKRVRRQTGRVTKKNKRPKAIRSRRPRNRAKAVRRAASLRSLITVNSSRSGNANACKVCGHRCCLRRYKFEERALRKQIRTKEETTQAGLSLSPLLVNALAVMQAEAPEKTYKDVTPEMIVESLKLLRMWREWVLIEDIVTHMKRNYPVNPSVPELTQELAEKLEVAKLVGIVTSCRERDVQHEDLRFRERWSLPSKLQRSDLDSSHVTLFWKQYADTMKPVEDNKRIRKGLEALPEDEEGPSYIS